MRAHCSAHRCAPSMLLGASGGGAALFKEHSTDLTPLLSCSEVIVRDPAHPYGPSRKASESARRGEYVVSPKSQLKSDSKEEQTLRASYMRIESFVRPDREKCRAVEQTHKGPTEESDC